MPAPASVRGRQTAVRSFRLAAIAVAAGAMLASSGGTGTGRAASPARPNVLIVSVDTLRADRLSALGYHRPTSPNLDRLLLGGVNFTEARTVEPLTNPAMSSILTSLPPHAHGATRNGLRIRRGLASLPAVLAEHGYRTGAFVGNWTLRDKLSGLGEHFEDYHEVLTRARWFGLVRSEATAEDLTGRTADWIERHARSDDGRPFLAWVHYVEPHAPYRLQKPHVGILGGERRKGYPPADRYDTEIAFVDAWIGELLRRIEPVSSPADTLVVLVSDHGESLGEHDYWGHGRNLYDPSLRIPMALYWKGRLAPATIEAPSLNLDLAPTVLGLLGLPVPEAFEGYDWNPVLSGSPAPLARMTRYEAHKGAVISKHDSDLARRSGLLEVALLQGGRKEIFNVKKNRRMVFDLDRDPGELRALVPLQSDPTDTLLSFMRTVFDRLDADADTPIEPLDEESVAALRSLGYVD